MKKVINIIKKNIFGVIIGLMLGSTLVYAGSNFYANGISVKAPNGSNLGSGATLEDAINDLYSIASNNDEIERRLTALENNTLTLDKIYPVGSIYISTDITSASDVAKKLGGEWEAYGTGKTLVGVDKNDANFNTADKTGGSSSTTLTTANLPSHNHSIPQLSGTAQSTGSGYSWSYGSAWRATTGAGSHSHVPSVSGWTFSVYLGSRSTETVGSIAGSGYKMSQVVESGSWGGVASTSTAPDHQHNSLDYYINGISGVAAHTHAVVTNASTTGSTGEGTAFSVQNPYITVYMYKRTK